MCIPSHGDSFPAYRSRCTGRAGKAVADPGASPSQRPGTEINAEVTAGKRGRGTVGRVEGQADGRLPGSGNAAGCPRWLPTSAQPFHHEDTKMTATTRSSTAMGLCLLLATGAGLAGSAGAGDMDWREKQIADALSAAPPAVTRDASVYAWNDKREMVLLRHGTGPYRCVASGNTSTRVGKPPLPYPDPMCLDQNAWNFFQVLWSQKNPMKPTRPYPTAPGMVWMLAGMGVGEGMVKIGASQEAQMTVTKSGARITRISPHLMIMPFPVDEGSSGLGSTYDPANPDASWVMFPKTPIEHVMVHFPDKAVEAMMNP